MLEHQVPSTTPTPSSKPRKAESERQRNYVQVSVTEEQMVLLERAAKKNDISKSAVLRDLVKAEMMREKGEYNEPKKWNWRKWF